MELLALLATIIIIPFLVVGGVQLLVYRFFGFWWLFSLNALIAGLCMASLVSAIFAPPIYGNRSGYVALGDATVTLLLLQSLAFMIAPLVKRYIAWDKRVQARWASEKIELSGRVK